MDTASTTKTTQMVAYLGQPDLKARFLEELHWHREQDKIIQRTYWTGGKGCLVGCSINSLARITHKRLDHENHALFETMLGVPRILARLVDRIFEGFPLEEARSWPLQFAEAIPVGTDLEGVWPRFALWLLMDTEQGVIRHAKREQTREAIEGVGKLYQRIVDGHSVQGTEWRGAAYAARKIARQEAFRAQAKKLLALLAAAPVRELAPALAGQV